MQGAVFMSYSNQAELNQLISAVYQDVHGKTIDQRRSEFQRPEKDFDEGYYDEPTIFRLGRFVR